jgi:hypothetical protein
MNCLKNCTLFNLILQERIDIVTCGRDACEMGTCYYLLTSFDDLWFKNGLDNQ